MKLVTHEDYLRFLSGHKEVTIEDVGVELKGNWKIESLAPPSDYQPETYNV